MKTNIIREDTMAAGGEVRFTLGGKTYSPPERLIEDERTKFVQLSTERGIPPQMKTVYDQLVGNAIDADLLFARSLVDGSTRTAPTSKFGPFLRSTNQVLLNARNLSKLIRTRDKQIAFLGCSDSIGKREQAVLQEAMKVYRAATNNGQRVDPTREEGAVAKGWFQSAAQIYDDYDTRLPHALHAEFMVELLVRMNPDFQHIIPIVTPHLEAFAAASGKEMRTLWTEFYNTYLQATKVDVGGSTEYPPDDMAPYEALAHRIIRQMTEKYNPLPVGGAASGGGSGSSVEEIPQYAFARRYFSLPSMEGAKEGYDRIMSAASDFLQEGNLDSFIVALEREKETFGGIHVTKYMCDALSDILFSEVIATHPVSYLREQSEGGITHVDARTKAVIALNNALFLTASELIHPFTTAEERKDFFLLQRQLFRCFKPTQGKGAEPGERVIETLREMSGKYHFNFLGKVLGRVWDTLTEEERRKLPESSTYAEDYISRCGAESSEKIFQAVRETFEEYAGVNTSHLTVDVRSKIRSLREKFETSCTEVEKKPDEVERISTSFVETELKYFTEQLYDGLSEQVLGGFYRSIRDVEAHPLHEALGDLKFSDHRLLDPRGRREAIACFQESLNRLNDFEKRKELTLRGGE